MKIYDKDKVAREPETSFEFIEEWFQKAIDGALGQGKKESALLWKDGLEHLRYFQAKTVQAQTEILDRAIEAVKNSGCTDECYSESGQRLHCHRVSAEALRKLKAEVEK